MTLSITGLALSTDFCSSLTEFEQFSFSGEDCKGNGKLKPSQAALDALEDGVLSDHNNLFIISSPHPDLVDLPQILNLGNHQYLRLLPEQDFGLNPLIQAEQMIREDPNRIVLLCMVSDTGTIALLLTHPVLNHPAYANLDPVQDPMKLASDGSELEHIAYFHISQRVNNINQETLTRIHELVPSKDPASIALGWIDQNFSEENELLPILFTAWLIHRKKIPGSPGGLQDGLVFPTDSPYYLTEYPRPWLDRGQNYIRKAFVYAPENGSAPSPGWILTEPKQTRLAPIVQISITDAEPHLILVPGNTIPDVLGNLQELETSLAEGKSLKIIKNDAYAKFLGKKYRLA
jgi:hypothetical protein